MYTFTTKIMESVKPGHSVQINMGPDGPDSNKMFQPGYKSLYKHAGRVVYMYVRLCVFESIFLKTNPPKVKVIQRSVLLRNGLWLPNLVSRTSRLMRNALLGSKVIQGSAGVNQRSNFLGLPMTTKCGRKSFWPKCNALLGSKVMQGSFGVKQRSNCSGMPYGYQIW